MSLRPTFRVLSKQRWFWIASVGLFIVACVAVVGAPKPRVVGQLQPPTTETTKVFSIVYFGPRQTAPTNGVITLVFSHPIVELTASGELPEQFATPTLHPAVPGKWIAVGSSTLQFHPERTRLPGATRFSVETAGISSLDGQALPAPHRFEFTTPLPRVVRHSPEAGAQGLSTETGVRLQFNQAVLPESLEPVAELRADGETVPFRLVPASDEPHAVLLQPTRALPRDAAIELQLSPGVRAEEGPLPSAEPFSLRFSTYGPLRAQLRCGWEECLPASQLVLNFSTPVRLSDVKQRLSCAPSPNLQWYDWSDETEFVQEVMVGVTLHPRQPYTCQLGPGLRDEYGQLLASTEPFEFVAKDYPSDLSVGVEGTYLDPRKARLLTLRSRNVSTYRLATALASPDYVAQVSYRPWSTQAVATLPGARWRSFTGGPLNTLHDEQLDLNELFRLSGATGTTAPLALQVSFVGLDGAPREWRQLIQVTDLALSAKLGPAGSLLWVTRLSTGKPQPNAQVELWDGKRVVLTRHTDDAGVVRLAADEYEPELTPQESRRSFVVRHESETLIAAEISYLGGWRMPIPPSLSEQRYRVQLFTDRGVYRPGHEVWVKGIVRKESHVGKEAIASGLPLRVRLNTSEGAELSAQTVHTNQFGSFALRFPIPKSARVGYWEIRAEGESLTETAPFLVSEYEPVEFEVAARASAASVINGETARFSTSAHYLFGAPLAGGHLRYGLSYQATSFTPAQSEGFVTDDDAYWVDLDSSPTRVGWLGSSKAVLDARGLHELELPLEVQNPQSPLLVRFDAEVSDVSRRAVAASDSVVLHPAQYYVGIEQLERSLVAAPHRFTPRVVALSPDGRRLANRQVELELLRRRWTSVHERTNDSHRQLHQRVDERVDHCTLTTRQTPNGCSLNLTESGYYILRATSTDAQQRQTTSSLPLYALGEGRISWRDDGATQHIELTADKPHYKVGETAKILIQSPFASANALITTERASVLEHRVVNLKGSTPTIDVPITEAHGSNVYVSVHLLRPSHVGADLELYRVGYTQLEVDTAERKLRVELGVPEREPKPGQQAKVDVVVRDHRGRPVRAEVTFFAVDEGVLALTDYQLPDPSRVFTQPSPLRVVTLETRSNLARLFTPGDLLVHNKGTEGGGGGDARATFVQTAHFAPSLITDGDGRARVSFKLGDNLTTYRLMAIALTKDDRYGSASDRLTVNKPLMARPALPRFLRAGDEFEAALAVSTRDFEGTDVEVQLEAKGVELTGVGRQQLRVSATGTQEVRFPVRAPTAGSAKLRFTVRASSGGHSDRVELERTIHSPAALETVAAYGAVNTVEGQRLGALERVRPDVGGLEVALASTRLVGLDASLEALSEYPYACTEQLASRLLPELPLRELALAFGFSSEAPPSPNSRLIRQLLERQQGSGGFGFWSSSPRSDPWVSAYTLWVLRLAERAGLAIDDWILTYGAEFLERELVRLAREHSTASPPAAAGVALELQAFISFVLAELGQHDPAIVERLLGSLEHLSVEGTAWLALAATAGRAPEQVIEPLSARLESFIVQDGNRATIQTDPNEHQRTQLLASRTRSQALVLYALLALNPQHRLAPALAHDLLARRTDGVWRTTQESAFSLLALDRYWRAQEPEPSGLTARVWLGNQPLITERFEGRTTTARVHQLEMPRLLAAGSLDLVVEASSGNARAPLFYEARLRYAPRELPPQPFDRGMSVLKLVRTVPAANLVDAANQSPLIALSDPSRSVATVAHARSSSTRSLPQQVLPVDQFVLVDLLVATAVTRNHVVIDDPLPAGLEAVDFALSTTSADLTDAMGNAEPLAGFATTWSEQELRDDRVLYFADELEPGLYRFQYLARPTTLGRFIVPPTRAFEMYQPEVSGRTGASFAVVQESRASAP